MGTRHLITGQNNCAPDGASSSNPFGALANALLGQSNKAESLKGLPGASVNVPTTSDYGTAAPLSTIPGSENEFKQDQRPFARGADFMRGAPANDWVESFRPPGQSAFVGPEANFAEFEQIYNNAGTTFGPVGPALDGPPQRVLSGVLHSFLSSGRAGVPFQPVPIPALGLSEGDKQCIRDRSCIMARHILADQPEEYIQAQVNTLLHSLDIDNSYRTKNPLHGPYPEMEEYWNQSQGALRSGPMHNAANSWITEFGKQNNNPEGWITEFGKQNNNPQGWITEFGKQNNNPEGWAHSFEQQYGPNGWASEFEQHQSQMAMGQMGGANMANLAAMQQSRMLAETLSSNNDPKFQNSKFFQFVSKMSRGELIIEDNEVKQGSVSQSSGWADEFQTQYNANPNTWADQFVHEELSQGADKWVSEFSSEQNHDGLNEKWIDEFSKLHVEDEWAEEFSGGAFGESSADPWAEEFQNQLSASKQSSGAARGVYVFSEMNPWKCVARHIIQCSKLKEESESRMVKLAFGSLGDSFSATSIKAYVSEFIATLLFVFAGVGSAIAYGKLTSDGALDPAGLVAIAIAHAFALFVGVAVAANISGGHLNPAVTFGLAVGGNITILTGIFYWVAQLLGSTAACFLLKFVTHGKAIPTHAVAAGMNEFEGVVMEIIITFALVYTVYATAADPKKGSLGTIAPIAIGFIVGANILAAGPFSGGSMNPARSFGPAVAAGNFAGNWVYWVGPLIGGGLAGFVYGDVFIASYQPVADHEYA